MLKVFDLTQTSFAMEKFGWTKAKTDDSLVPVIKQLHSGEGQKSILSYFPTSLSESRKLKSRRVKGVLNRMCSGGVGSKLPSNDSPSKGTQSKGKVSKRSKSLVTSRGGWIRGQRSQSAVTDPVLSEESDSSIDDTDLMKFCESYDSVAAAGNTDADWADSSKATDCKGKGKRHQSVAKSSGKSKGKEAYRAQRTSRASKSRALKSISTGISEESSSE